MKLSELTYDYLCSVGLPTAHMPTDCSDTLMQMDCQERFARAKADLMENYGDVNLIITPDAPWYDRVRIDDAKWRADFEDYCRRKAEWCKHNTAE